MKSVAESTAESTRTRASCEETPKPRKDVHEDRKLYALEIAKGKVKETDGLVFVRGR